MKKIIIFFIMGILLINISSALTECERIIFPSGSPCILFLPNNNTFRSCDLVNVTFYSNNQTKILSNKLMGNFTPFLCNVTFDFTNISTYTFFYSTGDSGSITIKEDVNNTYYLYVIAFIVFIILFIMGYWTKDTTFIVIDGMLCVVIAINLLVNGFPSLTNIFLKNSIVIVLIGIGFYLMLPLVEYSIKLWDEM